MRSKRGFSLIEVIITAVILAGVTTFAMMLIGPTLKARNVQMAVSTVSLEMSRARQLSVDSRRLSKVTFTTPRTITTEQRAPLAEGGAWTQVSQIELPGDMEFLVDSGVSVGPEGYGTDGAINFSGSSQVLFSPDGSAIVATDGQICNGVVYVARADELETTRAVTLFGATGRIKRWQYVQTDGSWE